MRSGRVAAAVAVALVLGLAQGGATVAPRVPLGWRVAEPSDWARGLPPQPAPVPELEALRDLRTAIATFPVYPGARPSTSAVVPLEQVAGGSTTIDLDRVWSTAAGALAVRAWLQKAAANEGWVSAGSATSGRATSPLVALAIQLTFSRGQGASERQVAVTLLPPAGGVALLPVLAPPDRAPTLMRYDVTIAWNPPRPPASLVPSDVARVEITVLPDAFGVSAGTVPQAIRTTLTGGARIAPLVAATNAIPLYEGQVLGCLAGGGTANVVFEPRRGRAVGVTVNSACYSAEVAGTYRLFDQGYRLWNAVLAAVGQPRLAAR